VTGRSFAHSAIRRDMIIDRDRSQLLVLDLQVKMLTAIHDHGQVLENVVWLVRAAQKIGVPVAATEQYAKGLGPTVPEVRALLPDGAIAGKTRFSCVAAECLGGLPGADRAQVILTGVEAHVCLLQTALELLEEGKEVYVVADGVGARRAFDRDMAVARMRQEGVRIVTKEMVVFEWLGESDTPLFRAVSKEFFRP
jgi:nicotinamidase-related amidase